MTSSFPKFVELGDLSSSGEPTIQLVQPYEYNKLYHVKAASEALDYIKHVKPQDGRTIILVLAMTAGEFYGGNRNGDGWPERPLQIMSTKITEDQVLPVHYKTFETYANIFKHHINKDPRKRVGDVLKAFYNWPMHRVELLLSLINEKAQDIAERIERGEFPAVSMGCKVKYDVCSICGNRARNRKEYCDDAKFRLGDYLPNGKRVIVWNPSPKFFDISLVRRPADKLGYMMKKVAEAVPDVRSAALLGEYIENSSRKVAALRKMSIIHKILRGSVGAIKGEDGNLRHFSSNLAQPMAEKMPPLDDNTMRSLIRYRPAQVLATLSSMGIILTTPEFLKFFIWQIDPSIEIPDNILDRAVAAQKQVFETLIDNPQILDEIDGTDFIDTSATNKDPELAKKLQPLEEKRSQCEQNLCRLALTKNALARPPLVRIPTYGYTRRPRNEIAKLAGAGALLSAAYGLLGNKQASESLLRPFDSYTESKNIYKISSFDHFDTANVMLRMAMDFAHRKYAKTIKLAALPATFPNELTFDTAATRIGRLITI